MMSQSESDLIVVFCAFPNEEDARSVATVMVGEGLCASVSVLSEMRTFSLWNGEMSSASECLCLLRTTASHFATVEARIREGHSYDVPEIFAVRPEQVSEVFARWVAGSVSG